jgi:hypothetical protein
MSSKLFSSFFSHKEIGVDYAYFQSAKIGSDEVLYDFQNSGVSPYFSFKSDAFSFGETPIGFYINSTLRYNSLNRQRGRFTNGAVYNKSENLGSEISILNLTTVPSLFIFQKFGNSGRGVFELFSGGGLTTYFGNSSVFKYPTAEEYAETNSTIFKTFSDGRVVYIEPPVDLGFLFGFNYLFGFRVKYIYDSVNLHFAYENLNSISFGGENLTFETLSFGVGFSF